ncbi:MAG: hypothetical protein WCE64_15900 [Bacteroidales bacterium]
MKKFAFLFAGLLIGAGLTAQVDFSGTWKLNTTKSKLGEQFSMAPKEIKIVQSGNDLNIEKHSSFQDQDFTTNDKLTLDGKECVNTAFQDMQKKSTCTWSEDKKSLKIATKLPMGDNGEMTINETYKLDGGNLVIESNTSSSFGEQAETQVYDKQ